MFTPQQLDRYARHFVLPQIGVSGQKQLLSSKVLVIGAGALSSPALMYLAAAGIGTIGIVDNDNVELSNLQRQIIYDTFSLGKSKAESAKKRIEAINPDINTILYRDRATADNICDLIRPYDFIIDGTDNFETKFLINDACVLENKPYSHAGIVRFEGQTMTYVPQRGPCLRCILDTVPRSDASCSCSQSGVLGAAVGVLGSIQACEAIKYLTSSGNLLTGRILKFDALTMTFHIINIEQSKECRVCGQNPSIISLTENRMDYERNNGCSLYEKIMGCELDICDYLNNRDPDDILIDLRDKIAFRHGSVKGAINIPPDNLTALYQLPKNKKIYVFCQNGTFSKQAVRILLDAGYEAYHLSGGYIRALLNN